MYGEVLQSAIHRNFMYFIAFLSLSFCSPPSNSYPWPICFGTHLQLVHSQGLYNTFFHFFHLINNLFARFLFLCSTRKVLFIVSLLFSYQKYFWMFFHLCYTLLSVCLCPRLASTSVSPPVLL